MLSSPSSVSSSSSPARGPSTIASATARLSVTTGPGDTCSRTPYRARICGQSVSAALGASSCTAAIAACSWYGPTGPRPSVRDTLGDLLAGPELAPLLRERVQRAVVLRPRGSPGLGEQHQREQPRDIVRSGEQPPQQARQPDRLGRPIRTLQVAF